MYGDSLPINVAGTCSSKNVRTMLVKCGEANLNFFCGGLYCGIGMPPLS